MNDRPAARPRPGQVAYRIVDGPVFADPNRQPRGWTDLVDGRPPRLVYIPTAPRPAHAALPGMTVVEQRAVAHEYLFCYRHPEATEPGGRRPEGPAELVACYSGDVRLVRPPLLR